MTERDSHITDVVGAPLTSVSVPAVPAWPAEGNVAIGVVCGITLSAPVWLGLIGAVRALLG